MPTLLAVAAGVQGRDLGGGKVALNWTYPADIAAQQIAFDVYSSADPLDLFHTLRATAVADTSVTVSGFTESADQYFTVVATRGNLQSLPSKAVRVSVKLDAAAAMLSPARMSAAAPSSGLGFPFQIDGSGGVYAQGGDPLLRGKILQLLLTSPGERVNLPEYGTRLRDLVFDFNDDILAATTEFMINRALQNFLGDEIQVDKVQIGSQAGELDVDIVYLKKADLSRERLRIGIPIP